MSALELAEDEPFGLAEPQSSMLASYACALRAGWSPDTSADVCGAELAAIANDPVEFIYMRSDAANRCVVGRSIVLPDGTSVQRIPMRERWIWDGAFSGRISVRFQPGTDALPEHILGHVGYAVVPWKQKRGYARRALGLILVEARRVGLRRIEITCNADNVASCAVILANNGKLIEQFEAPHYGACTKLRFGISLV